MPTVIGRHGCPYNIRCPRNYKFLDGVLPTSKGHVLTYQFDAEENLLDILEEMCKPKDMGAGFQRH